MTKTLAQLETERLKARYESALRVISQFSPPEELREDEEFYGLPYEEILEMAYENIIFEANRALDGTF